MRTQKDRFAELVIGKTISTAAREDGQITMTLMNGTQVVISGVMSIQVSYTQVETFDDTPAPASAPVIDSRRRAQTGGAPDGENLG